MVLDVQDFITSRGGNPAKIKESQRRRHAPEAVVDDIIALWEDHQKTTYAVTQIAAKANAIQDEVKARKKAKADASDLIEQKKDLEKEKKHMEASAAEKELLLKKRIKTVGNYVHDSVPVSDNEDNNQLIREWTPEGVTVEKRDCLSHHEVLTRIDGYDPARGTKIAGHRGYALTDYGLLLNQALINYGLHFLRSKSYKLCQPPYFMLREPMAATAQLEQFDEELYKVTESADPATDKYLIATSEQPISAMHADEWLQEKDLPIKYAGYSTCYRKEAGKHGKEAWGIFRIHQFEKVEQFLFTKPEDSWQAFDAMIENSEEFYKSLKIPYRIVAIVSGALNNAAAKKYDLEAWFPFQGEYKELVSCSNCTDYQSRALNIRYGPKSQIDNRKTYVHALNSTLCATERALCCIMENYQSEEGMIVPEVLRPYIPGNPEIIPYVKELPKDSTSLAGKADAVKGNAKTPAGNGSGSTAAKKVENAASTVTDSAHKAVQAVQDKIAELRT